MFGPVVRCSLFQEVRYKVHDPKAHSKGGTLENTINGRADEEAPPLPPAFPPPKDPAKVKVFEMSSLRRRIFCFFF